MSGFTLDARLRDDCVVLGELQLSLLLLMDNALLPWFILVPRVSAAELHELSGHEQAILCAETQALSRFIQAVFAVDKLNVAAIGNVVNQLHVHVVGRQVGDFCWPGVVWGRDEHEPYQAEALRSVRVAVDKDPGLAALRRVEAAR